MYYPGFSRPKKILLLIAFLSLPSLSNYIFAASFNCEAKLSSVETEICNNPSLSALDENMALTYRAIYQSSNNKKLLRNDQRSWIKNIRNKCSDLPCLEEAHKDRIKYLLSLTQKPEGVSKNFSLSQGAGLEMCEEYLKILNNTPITDIRACSIPDLKNSSIKNFEFDAVKGERLRELDRIIYAGQGGGIDPSTWEAKWPDRKQKYQSGYHMLRESYWDMNNDGEEDLILEYSFPSSSCSILGRGEVSKLRRIKRNHWKTYSDNEKLEISKKNGMLTFYFHVDGEKLIPTRNRNIIEFDNIKYNVSHDEIIRLNTTNKWVNKSWIRISKIGSKLNSPLRRYREGTRICTFDVIKKRIK